MGISGLQVNYAHSDQGGRSYGLTYPSEPPLFSPEWWDLFQWFLKSAKQKGDGGEPEGAMVFWALAKAAMSTNLLTLHGLYSQPTGGYWEWAPPSGSTASACHTGSTCADSWIA